MAFLIRNILEKVHARVRMATVVCSRLLMAVVVLGSLFSLLAWSATQVFQTPEVFFRMQAFRFTHYEFSTLSAQHVAERARRNPGREASSDPDWDGAFAGASLGLTLGRNVPLIGGVLGPVAGGVIGYRMDKRI